MVLSLLLVSTLQQSDEINISGECPCQKYYDMCTPGCCCDPNCPGYTGELGQCLDENLVEILPKCGNRLGLTDIRDPAFLLKELFCIHVDNRKSKSESYSNNAKSSYKPVFPSEKSYNEYTYETPLILEGGKKWSIPYAMETDTCSQREVRFLEDLETVSCTSTGTFDIDGISICAEPSCEKKVKLNIPDSTGGEAASEVQNAGKESVVILKIYYDNQNHITRAEAFVTESTETTETSQEEEGTQSKIKIGLTFIDETSVGNNSEGSTDVNSRDARKISLRSGEEPNESEDKIVGFIGGESIIGGILKEETSTMEYEEYKLPFGGNCQNAKSVPIQFGVDMVGGCSSTDGKYDVGRPEYLLAYSEANMSKGSSWVKIGGDEKCIETNPVERIAIFTESFGRVDSPQYRIVQAKRMCTASLKSDSYLYAVSFAKNQNQKTKPFVPPFPKSLPALPDDFFFPFNRN